MSENKVQKIARKRNIINQQQLRDKLRPYGIAEGTARKIWLQGANTQNHYAAIVALEKVLLTPADQFIEDLENLMQKADR